MRIRNVWFELFTFYFAWVWVASFVSAIVDFWHGRGQDAIIAAMSAVLFLALAVLFFWLSLRLGNYQRRSREIRRRARRMRARNRKPAEADSPTA